jgi:hypothetical protein
MTLPSVSSLFRKRDRFECVHTIIFVGSSKVENIYVGWMQKINREIL